MSRSGRVEKYAGGASTTHGLGSRHDPGVAARALEESRDQVEHWLRTVDDPWLHVRRDAMLGELARVDHRFDAAVEHIARAAEISGRLGFLQTEAYQVSSLGRAQCQAGDYAEGTAWFGVSAVPAVIFSEKISLVGAVPVERYRAILDWILAGEPGGLLPIPADDAAAGATQPGAP